MFIRAMLERRLQQEAAEGGEAGGGAGSHGVSGQHPGVGNEPGEGDAGKEGGNQGDAGGNAGDGGEKGSKKADGLLASAAGEGAEGDKGGQGGEGDGRPEGLPEQFWDAEAKTVRAESLVKSWKDTRTELEQLKAQAKKGLTGKAPEKPDAYELAAPQDFPVELPADDPGVKAFREIAHKHGLTQEQAQGVFEEYLQANADNYIPPLDIEQEKARIGKNADAVIRAVYDWGKGLKEQGVWSEDEFQEIVLMGSTAEGIRALNKMRQHYGGGHQIPTRASVEDGLPSEEELYSMVNDPKYGADPAFTEKVSELFKRFYGDQPAGSSPNGKGVPKSSSGLAAWQQPQNKG